MLQKNPAWTSADVLEAVTSTGTMATDPDTLYGWGILRALDASNYDPASGITLGRTAQDLLIYPNPCRSSLTLRSTAHPPSGRVSFYDVQGRLLDSICLDSRGVVSLDIADIGAGLSPGVAFVVVPGVGRAKLLILE